MLLTLTVDGDAAADLSYLLHKRPDRFQSFDASFGKAHVFYPEVSGRRCVACLMLQVDPVGMAKKNVGLSQQLAGYVNDRPFVASSFLSTAIASVFGSALAGRCKDRPAAVAQELDLVVNIEALPVRGGESLLRGLFEPLGYEVNCQTRMLDSRFPDWGESPYFNVTLRTRATLSGVLNHLYVLIPVFDNQKHYFVGGEEIDKLLSKGEGWLASHPQAETISRRYLRRQGGHVRRAMERLNLGEDSASGGSREDTTIGVTGTNDDNVPLNQRRYEAVADVLIQSGATSVIDLGCGEGKFLKVLMSKKQFGRIVGMDVAVRALEIAARRLRLDTMPEKQRQRIELIHGSLMYRDRRIAGFDAACLVEVIEHLDPPRLAAMRRVVFGAARPGTVVVTTPNSEYNVVWETLPAGKFRHADHRFEWTRAQFESWCGGVGETFGYEARFDGIGDAVDELGSPTQMAVFQRTT